MFNLIKTSSTEENLGRKTVIHSLINQTGDMMHACKKKGRLFGQHISHSAPIFRIPMEPAAENDALHCGTVLYTGYGSTSATFYVCFQVLGNIFLLK